DKLQLLVRSLSGRTLFQAIRFRAIRNMRLRTFVYSRSVRSRTFAREMVETILFRCSLWIIQRYQQLQVFFAHDESPCSLLTHMALTPHRCGLAPFEAAATALGSRIRSADWLSQSSKRTLPSSASLPGTSEFSLSSVPK